LPRIDAHADSQDRYTGVYLGLISINIEGSSLTVLYTWRAPQVSTIHK
jgi:hypothetical protein